jgi:hypothetical protein
VGSRVSAESTPHERSYDQHPDQGHADIETHRFWWSASEEEPRVKQRGGSGADQRGPGEYQAAALAGGTSRATIVAVKPHHLAAETASEGGLDLITVTS